MDSCVYVWARRNVFKNGSHGAPPHETVPTKLEGHGGSVSDVLADDGRVASASYDKTVRLWRLQKTQKKSVVKSVGSTATAVATLRGHRAPALRLAARLESGANADVADVRDDAFGAHAFGLVRVAGGGDRGAAVPAGTGVGLVGIVARRTGSCTALRWVEGADPNATPLLASGGRDGAARFWDDRQGGRPGASARARARGAGAVSEIAQCAGAAASSPRARTGTPPCSTCARTEPKQSAFLPKQFQQSLLSRRTRWATSRTRCASRPTRTSRSSGTAPGTCTALMSPAQTQGVCLVWRSRWVRTEARHARSSRRVTGNCARRGTTDASRRTRLRNFTFFYVSFT